MPHDTHDRSARVLALRDVLPLAQPEPEGAAEPVSVTVVGADARVRDRVVELLAGTPGVRVAGWADSLQALTVLDLSSGVVLTVAPEAAARPADPGRSRPADAGGSTGPDLSPRQEEVLAAYTAGNELLDTVARRLGMGPETLKTHLRRIRAKYEAAGRPAPTRRDLYVRAVQDGLVAPPR
jgi:DNA-binding CsgD family transcriptional regulator